MRFKSGDIYTHTQLIHTVVWQKLKQHCKAIIFQSKKMLNRGEKKVPSSPIHPGVQLIYSDEILQNFVFFFLNKGGGQTLFLNWELVRKEELENDSSK